MQQATGAGAAPTGLLSSPVRWLCCSQLSGGVAGVVRVAGGLWSNRQAWPTFSSDGAIGCALALPRHSPRSVKGSQSGHLEGSHNAAGAVDQPQGETGVFASPDPSRRQSCNRPIVPEGRAGRAADGRTPADRGKNNLRPPAHYRAQHPTRCRTGHAVPEPTQRRYRPGSPPDVFVCLACGWTLPISPSTSLPYLLARDRPSLDLGRESA